MHHSPSRVSYKVPQHHQRGSCLNRDGCGSREGDALVWSLRGGVWCGSTLLFSCFLERFHPGRVGQPCQLSTGGDSQSVPVAGVKTALTLKGSQSCNIVCLSCRSGQEEENSQKQTPWIFTVICVLPAALNQDVALCCCWSRSPPLHPEALPS